MRRVTAGLLASSLEAGDLVEHRLRVLVPGPQAFEVEHTESAVRAPVATTVSGRHGRERHRRSDDRHVELVGIDLPGDGDVLGNRRVRRLGTIAMSSRE